MLSDVMAHGIYDQTQTYTAYATVSSGEELADVISEVGPENIISAEEIQPAVSAYTYELRSIADLDDGWQNLKDLSSTLSVVTYEAKYERLSNGTVIDEETPLRAEMTDAVGPFVSLISSLDDASTGTTGGLSSFRYECSAGVHIKPAFKSISEVNLSSVEYLRSNISVDPPDPGFIDVRIEQPGVSSVAYLSGQTYHYFFADFHYDKLHTDADDKYTLLSTYLVSVDFDYLLSSPEHGYDLVSEASFEQGIPGSLMLIA